MPKIDFENRILLSITGRKKGEWKEKLEDLNELKIKKAALFLEGFDQRERKKIYRALLDSTLKEIPLCHAGNDMEIEEFVFLENKFKTKYFTIHESGFGFLDKWPGFKKKLYLEMNVDDYVSPKVRIEDIGGFCVDLSHFKMALTSWTKDFDYTYLRKNKVKFGCNHLNGYNPEKNHDMHTVKSLKDFDYLKTLPKFIFSKFIALEMYNSIDEQIKFKKYLKNLLLNHFHRKI
ncbi:MAG: hypothetical protein NTZ84_02540 [Candidatus Nealsonbacteria bacterium]|nr:hypothetical protein [Candidatus Nealsonbacteria bacterium]